MMGRYFARLWVLLTLFSPWCVALERPEILSIAPYRIEAIPGVPFESCDKVGAVHAAAKHFLAEFGEAVREFIENAKRPPSAFTLHRSQLIKNRMDRLEKRISELYPLAFDSIDRRVSYTWPVLLPRELDQKVRRYGPLESVQFLPTEMRSRRTFWLSDYETLPPEFPALPEARSEARFGWSDRSVVVDFERYVSAAQACYRDLELELTGVLELRFAGISGVSEPFTERLSVRLQGNR